MTTGALVTGLDHVILGVEDLAAATDLVTMRLGLHTCGGGVHPAFGTANRLVVLADDYIELLAPQAGSAPRGFIGDMLVAGHQGWVGFALQTPHPERVAALLRERGVAVDGPTPGRLSSDEGFSRAWETVRVADALIPGLPFLIRHEASGDERRRLLAGAAGLAPHRLGARTIVDLTVAVPALDPAIAAYHSCFDLRVEARGSNTMLDAETATLRLNAGTTITLAAPQRPGAGPVAESLREGHPGLFAVTLAVADLRETVRELRASGLGVRVDEAGDELLAAQVNHRQLLGARIALVQQASRPAGTVS